MVARFAVLAAALAAWGCTSPESERALGGGAGADLGNRGEVVLMHEGAQPYYGTPQVAPGTPGPVEGASHAHRLSLE